MTTILDIIAKTTGTYLDSKTKMKELSKDETVRHVKNAGQVGGAMLVIGLIIFAMWFLFGLDGLWFLFQWFFWSCFMFLLVFFCVAVAALGCADEADHLMKIAHKYAKEELGKAKK